MYTAIVELEDGTKMSYEPTESRPSEFSIEADVYKKLRNFNDYRKIKSTEIIPLHNSIGGYKLNEVYKGWKQKY